MSLARKLKTSEASLTEHLLALGLAPNINSNKPATITVPDAGQLKSLLRQHGVQLGLLEPTAVQINGAWHRLKWFQSHPVIVDDTMKFDVVLHGKLGRANVCCHDLNISARALVSIQSA